MIKILLMIIGFISVGLGILGLFLPLVPTTPFLLLAAACFAKSSEKMYNRLISNKYLGKYIINYREHRSMTRNVKISTIVLLWASMIFSAFFATSNIWIRIGMFIIASAVTFHLYKLKTHKEENEKSKSK